MSEKPEYVIRTDIRFGPFETIDVPTLVRECEHDWFNQSLCTVNDCVLRFGRFDGDFHWHKHDAEDEVFYVVSGRLFIDLEDRSVELGPQQATLVPRGVLHRPRAPAPTVVLMIEGAGVSPTGDA